MAARNLRDVGDRVEELLAELAGAGDPAAEQRAEELVRLLMELYGAALERIVEVVADGDGDGGGGDAVLRLADDPLVASLLVLHGLHPVPADERIRRALEAARGRTGPVKVRSLEDGVVRVEMDGACGSGCGALAARQAVEETIVDAAPEVARVEFVSAATPVAFTNGAKAPAGPVPVSIGPARRSSVGR